MIMAGLNCIVHWKKPSNSSRLTHKPCSKSWSVDGMSKTRPPPLAVAVPEKVKQYSVKSASLSDYDQLSSHH